MAKYLLQEMPDLNKAGQRRVYPKLIANRTLSTKDVVEGLHSYNRALSESVVEAVLTDLSDHPEAHARHGLLGEARRHRHLLVVA